MLDGVRTGSIDARLHSVGAVGAGQFVPVTFGEEMQAFMVFYCIHKPTEMFLPGAECFAPERALMAVLGNGPN